jgi:hypothetical protein
MKIKCYASENKHWWSLPSASSGEGGSRNYLSNRNVLGQPTFLVDCMAKKGVPVHSLANVTVLNMSLNCVMICMGLLGLWIETKRRLLTCKPVYLLGMLGQGEFVD